MSWPLVKPPWKEVEWLSWPSKDGQPINWLTRPNPLWIEKKEIGEINELHMLKEEIEKLDKKGEWEFLKRSSNPYELVYSQSEDPRIPKSISVLKPLSRSFFKLIEILEVMDFYKRHSNEPSINTAHVCEGPGGFIEALFHISQTSPLKIKQSWAMTLKPTKSNIPGWKRAFHFLKRNQNISIEYGADNTGNILIPENQGSFLEKTRSKCHIFTADGGFDFSEHYETQEEEVLPLLISSVLIGLQTLVKGGDFILKVFDVDNKATIDTIAILASCFEDWVLYKPSLSRPCNAEKYFLGRGYKIAPGWIFKTLVEIRNAYLCDFKHIEYIFKDIPEPIKTQINNTLSKFTRDQVGALKYAIEKKEKWNSNPQEHWKQIKEYSVQWCKNFKIPFKDCEKSSALVNKENPIPWNQVVASRMCLTSDVQL